MASSWPIHKVQKISNALDWQMNCPVNWSKINCTLKSQTLTFWSKSSAKGHFSSRWVKILPKLGQNFSKLKVLGTLVPKNITWDPSFFWENFVNQSCILCGGLQLSCWKFCLNPIASWWKCWGKLEKIKKIS